jgi:hypothetical protein
MLTSPSGIHLGYYKALIIHPNDAIPYTDKSREFLSNGASTIQARVNLLNYGLKHSFLLERWQNILKVQ